MTPETEATADEAAPSTLAESLRQIKANSEKRFGAKPSYGKRDKFWVANNTGLFQHEDGGIYLLVFRTRGRLLQFHREDPNLQTTNRNDCRLVRYAQLRELCIDRKWNGIILDPPVPSDDNPDVDVEILALAPPGR